MACGSTDVDVGCANLKREGHAGGVSFAREARTPLSLGASCGLATNPLASLSPPPARDYFFRMSPFERCVIASLRPSSVRWNIGNTLPICSAVPPRQ